MDVSVQKCCLSFALLNLLWKLKVSQIYLLYNSLLIKNSTSLSGFKKPLFTSQLNTARTQPGICVSVQKCCLSLALVIFCYENWKYHKIYLLYNSLLIKNSTSLSGFKKPSFNSQLNTGPLTFALYPVTMTEQVLLSLCSQRMLYSILLT
jgi:hypothetical protein